METQIQDTTDKTKRSLWHAVADHMNPICDELGLSVREYFIICNAMTDFIQELTLDNAAEIGYDSSDAQTGVNG